MTGYGIEIWEKDLETGELTKIREDNDNKDEVEYVDGDTGEPIEEIKDLVYTEEDSIVEEKPKKRSKRTTYTEEHFNFLRENVNQMKNPKLAKKFNKEFGCNLSVANLSNQLSKAGIKRSKKIVVDNLNDEDITEKPVCKPFRPGETRKEELKVIKRKGMSEEVIKFIEKNYLEKTDAELREKIADKYGAFHDVNKISNYRESNGMARPEGWSPEGFKEETN